MFHTKNFMISNFYDYPYNIFTGFAENLLLFDPITVLYGNNAKTYK